MPSRSTPLQHRRTDFFGQRPLGLAASLAASLARWQNLLGLAQNRCVHCLRPFSAPDAARYESAAAPASVYPPMSATTAETRLCPDCLTLLAPYVGPHCPRCGLPPANPHEGNVVCGACLQNPPPWSGIAFHGLYRGALRHTLLRLKFDGHLYLAPLLGGFLLDAVGCLPRPDVIIAVPQHPEHLRRRGYNQAHELAKALHGLSGVPLGTRMLARPVPGKEQEQLNAMARRSNVRHSFAAEPAVNGLRVWLVDDVLTTGSTMAAAARALLAGGAARVDAVFAARTPLNSAPQPTDVQSTPPCRTSTT